MSTRSKIKEKLIYYFKKYHIWYALLVAALYYGKLLMYKASNRINPDYHIIDMKIDDLIPFCKYFMFFYFTYYWFTQLQMYLVSYGDKRKFYRMIIAAAISCVIANICFLIYQVKMIRPEITGNDPFDLWVKWIYKRDPKALNCLPSIHAVMGVCMIIGGYKTKKMPKWLNITGIVFGIGCILSTVFVKQHYFIDMVAGTILMFVVYYAVLLVDKKLQEKQKSKQKITQEKLEVH